MLYSLNAMRTTFSIFCTHDSQRDRLNPKSRNGIRGADNLLAWRVETLLCNADSMSKRQGAEGVLDGLTQGLVFAGKVEHQKGN